VGETVALFSPLPGSFLTNRYCVEQVIWRGAFRVVVRVKEIGVE
jgi:hypothetical protein